MPDCCSQKNPLVRNGTSQSERLLKALVPSYIKIDEKAIATDLNHKYVLLLGPDNKVAYRAVELGQRLGELRVIKSGLSAGDVILVDGLQRARPDSIVAPMQVAMATVESLEALLFEQRVKDQSVSESVTVPVNERVLDKRALDNKAANNRAVDISSAKG